MITYQTYGGRLGENISFIYGLFKFCKNNHIPYDNIKINLDYKSNSLVNNEPDEYVFKDNLKMFDNISYVFKESDYFKYKDLYYIDLKNSFDLANFYNFFNYNSYLKDKDICFCNWWSLDKYYLTEKFDFELLYYICCPRKIVKILRKKYCNILNNSLAIHVRRGDYVSLINPNILKNSTNDQKHFIDKKIYSKDDIDKLYLDNYKKYKNIVIFSDDINWCKDNFGMYSNIHFIENNLPYEDMILMGLCTDIICNHGSYFSRVSKLINIYEKNFNKNS